MLLFPPFTGHYIVFETAVTGVNQGYHFILSPPYLISFISDEILERASVNIAQLFTQWFLIITVAGAFYLTL